MHSRLRGNARLHQVAGVDVQVDARHVARFGRREVERRLGAVFDLNETAHRVLLRDLLHAFRVADLHHARRRGGPRRDRVDGDAVLAEVAAEDFGEIDDARFRGAIREIRRRIGVRRIDFGAALDKVGPC